MLRAADLVAFALVAAQASGRVCEPAFPRDVTAAPVISVAFDIAFAAHAHYDHDKSSSYHANGTAVRVPEYALAFFDAEGFVSRDQIQMGGGGVGWEQSFVEMTGPDDELKFILAADECEGIFGLGPSLASVVGESSIVRSLFDQKQIARPIVGLELNDLRPTLAKFGGVDEAYSPEDFTFYELDRDDTPAWTAPLTGISVGDKPVVGDVGRVVLANTPFIWGPPEQINEVYRVLGAVHDTVPCEGPGPELVVYVGDSIRVVVPKKEYTIPNHEQDRVLRYSREESRVGRRNDSAAARVHGARLWNPPRVGLASRKAL